MSKFTDQKFVYTTYIKTTPEKLWEALTHSEFTRQYWFGTNMESDWKEGSAIKYVTDGKVMVQGKILVAKPYSVLSYTFHEEHDPDSLKEPPTQVTLEIEPEAGTETVRLIVTHTHFVEKSSHFRNISGGWPVVLSGLKSLLETGKALEFES